MEVAPHYENKSEEKSRWECLEHYRLKSTTWLKKIMYAWKDMTQQQSVDGKTVQRLQRCDTETLPDVPIFSSVCEFSQPSIFVHYPCAWNARSFLPAMGKVRRNPTTIHLFVFQTTIKCRSHRRGGEWFLRGGGYACCDRDKPWFFWAVHLGSFIPHGRTQFWGNQICYLVRNIMTELYSTTYCIN